WVRFCTGFLHRKSPYFSALWFWCEILEFCTQVESCRKNGFRVHVTRLRLHLAYRLKRSHSGSPRLKTEGTCSDLPLQSVWSSWGVTHSFLSKALTCLSAGR